MSNTPKMKDIKIPDAISSRTKYKRKYSFGEMYRAFVMIPSALTKLIGNKKKKLVDKDFIERLQLAVTEVNGCAACSYAHTYMALKQGMSNEEIDSFLSGDGKFINQEEAKAIVFAQHYADSRGFPKIDAYKSIIDEYGDIKAKIILSAIQLMFAANIYGIPYSAFQSRLKGKPYKDSSLLYELGMQIAGVISLPIALVHGVIKSILGFSNIRFGEIK
jgi:AhpD family alkylhydroperoxidase